MTWEMRAICKCGWNCHAPFGDRFHIHRECCPECGADKYTWEIQKARNVLVHDGFSWWKPLTWAGKWKLEVYPEE